MKTKSTWPILLLLCLAGVMNAQQLKRGENHVGVEIIEDYMDFAGSKAVVFNGKTELPYNLNLTNHSYMVTSDYTSGELIHNNIYYKDVMLRYDLYMDQLLVLMPENPYSIILEKEKVAEAYLNGYHIVRYDKNRWPDIPQCNYLFFLHDGKYPVLKRYQVTLEQNIEGRQVEYSFRMKERFYIYKDDVYHQISGKSSLLKLFRDEKKELKAYIRQHKLNFRKDGEQAIKAIVEYRETLNK